MRQVETGSLDGYIRDHIIEFWSAGGLRDTIFVDGSGEECMRMSACGPNLVRVRIGAACSVYYVDEGGVRVT